MSYLSRKKVNISSTENDEFVINILNPSLEVFEDVEELNNIWGIYNRDCPYIKYDFEKGIFKRHGR